MTNDLQFCPGNSLPSFLRTISYDLKWRQIEYLILAFFNDKENPIAMRQVTGRTSWVAYSVDRIIAEAKELNASGICIVHNHPTINDEKPDLKPSLEDISFQQQFLDACQTSKLSYLGSWISSKGQFTEILYYVWQTAIRKQDSLTDQELLKINYALTPAFTDTVKSLTKPIIIVTDEYVIGKIENNYSDTYGIFNLSARAMNSYPLIDPYSGLLWLKLTIDFSEIEFLSYEELNRACYGISELCEESKRLSCSSTMTYIKYKKIELDITNKLSCGFYHGGYYHEGIEQDGFIIINNKIHTFEISTLQKIHQLFDKALIHLDSLSKA